MTELIAILLLTLGQLSAQGVPDAALAAGIEKAVMDDPPVAIGAMAVEVSREEQEPGEPPRADIDWADAPYMLKFVFEDIYIDPLEVQALSIQIGGVQLLADGRVELGSVEFSAELADSALTATLAPQVEQLPGFSIKCDDGAVTLSGRYAAWIAEVPFEVVGNLGIEHKTELVFSIGNSKLVGLRLPAKLNEIIEGEVNPVFDLLDFAQRSSKDFEKLRERLVYEFTFKVELVKAQDGHIFIKGKA